MKRALIIVAAALAALAGYVAYVVNAPVCVVHEGPVMFSALGRAERAVLPQRAGALHYAWRGQGSSFCSVTRFDVPNWAEFTAAYPFRPVRELPPAFAAVPQELAQLPWWQPQRAQHLLLAEIPEHRAYLAADEEEQTAYLLVLEND